MRKTAALCIILLALASCAQSPEPEYYVLSALPGDQHTDVATVVRIDRPALADYLDRPDFVKEADTTQISFDETNNWGEPLQLMFCRVLAADLQQRLPSSVIVTEDNPSSAVPDFVIDTNVARFNQTTQNKAVFEGETILTEHRAGTKPSTSHIELMEDTGSSAHSVAESLSRATADYADSLALVLSSIPADQAKK